MRILFALSQAIKHKKELKQLAINSQSSIAEINFQQLKDQNIKVVVFDFDGVLASHGEVAINTALTPVVTNALQLFPEKVVILSNKPMQKRIAWFEKHFPQIDFVVAKRKKPYPEGLQSVVDKYQIEPREAVLIDDRLLTGCLAAVLAKTSFIYINKPRTNINKRPTKELFFGFLRWFERVIFL